METDRSSSGWGPYWIPYFGFLALGEIQGRLPEEMAPYLRIVRVVLTAGCLIYFWRRGGYPELRNWRPTPSGVVQDVLLGLATTALWVGPFLLWQGLSRPAPGEGFDPQALGPALAPWLLFVRFFGFTLVTPFMEELFVRSFLIRYLDVFDTGEDFRDVPMARFQWRSFLGTWAAFTFTHAPWEWPVAAATGLLWNLWLYKRGHIASLVLVHAVTNGSLFLLVWLGSGRLPDGHGGLLDLWYFL